MPKRRCSSCGDFVKGHAGPTGDSCKNSQEPESPSQTSLLVNELAKLSIAMEKIADNQEKILKVVSSPPTPIIPVVIPPSPSVSRSGPDHIQAAAASGSSAVAPHVSEKTTTAAQIGEFVDLVEFLPTTHSYNGESEMYIANGSIETRPKRNKRTIDNCYTWLMAWNIYEQVIIEKRPDMYFRLVKYRTLIQQCDRRYSWHAIYSYDIQFRAKCGAKKSFAFDELDVTLYTTILDATAIRSGGGRQCLRCRSYDHIVRECPFPEEATLAQTSEKKQKSQPFRGKDKWFHRNIEGCNNYQFGRCFFTGCKRAHVCQNCRGPEPLYKCGCDREKYQVAAQTGGMGQWADKSSR